MTIYSEVVSEADEMLDVATLERLMWTKISGGATRASNRIPWVIAKKIKVQLPYLPSLISYTGCQGLKKCDGLYVPCGGKCTEESILCLTCEKHGAKFGVLEERGEAGSYTDPMDKREITYGTWLQKHEKTIEDVNAAIQEAGFDFEIPASYLAVNARRVAVKKAGRPKSKKEVTESDSESEGESSKSGDDKPKKKARNIPITHSKAKKAAKKASDDEEEPKVEKPKKKAAKATSDDEEPKVEKPKKKATKKASDDEEEPKVEEPKVEKPKKKAAPKAKKSDDEEEPKVEKPKKKAAPKAKKSDDDEEKPKKAKAKSPKAETLVTEMEEMGIGADMHGFGLLSNSLAVDEYEDDVEDELVVHGGVEYTLRGKSLFNEDGEFVGTMVNGEAVLR